jgi:hypothetical protein
MVSCARPRKLWNLHPVHYAQPMSLGGKQREHGQGLKQQALSITMTGQEESRLTAHAVSDNNNTIFKPSWYLHYCQSH